MSSLARRLIAAWVLLLALAGFTRTDRDPYGLEPIASAMSFDGVQVVTQWRWCGQVNAFYSPESRTITLCHEDEIVLPPAVLRFFYAHEWAHAVIHQRDIPITGYEEVAADELATVILTVTGHGDDVLATAYAFLEMGRPEHPADPHTGDIRRGLALACLVTSRTKEVPDVCEGSNDWRVTVKRWNRLLEIDH